MAYKFLSHTADISFLVEGKTIEELFLFSAEALKKSITKQKIKEKILKKIKLKENNLEALLCSFLEEMLFFLEAKFLILSRVESISIKKKNNFYFLESSLYFDKVNNYKISNPIKAITYSEMKIEKQKNKFKTKVVLDS